MLYEGVVAGIVGEPLDAGLGDPRQRHLAPLHQQPHLVERGYVEPGDIVVPVDYTGTECEFAFPVLPAGPDGGVLVPGPGGLFLVTRTTALAVTSTAGRRGCSWCSPMAPLPPSTAARTPPPTTCAAAAWPCIRSP